MFVASHKLDTVNTFFLSFKHKSCDQRVPGSAGGVPWAHTAAGRGRDVLAAAWWSQEEVERDCHNKMPCVGRECGFRSEEIGRAHV